MMDISYYHIYRELRKLAHEDTITLACALSFVYEISEENSFLIVNLVSQGKAFDISLLRNYESAESGLDRGNYDNGYIDRGASGDL